MRSMITFVAPAALALALILAPGARAQTGTTSHQARVEERIKDMYATLHITKMQDPEWNAFAQVMMDNASAMDAALQQYKGDPATETANVIMDNYAGIAAQHAQNVERVAAAFDVLYASLSPEQKQAADAMFRTRAEKKAEEHKTN